MEVIQRPRDRIQISDETVGRESNAVYDHVTNAVLDLFQDTRIDTSQRSKFVATPTGKLQKLYNRVVTPALRNLLGDGLGTRTAERPLNNSIEVVDQSNLEAFSAYNVMRGLVGAAVLQEIYEEDWDWKARFQGHPRECFEEVASEVGQSIALASAEIPFGTVSASLTKH